MSNNGNKNGKKKGVLGTAASLIAVLIIYLVSGNIDGKQDTIGAQDTQSTVQTQETYESQAQQDTPEDTETDVLSDESEDSVITQDNIDDNQDTVQETTEQTTEVADNEKEEEQEETPAVTYSFRNEGLLESHYEKHGIEMGFDSAEEYEAAASRVVNNPDALYKLEAEDNDHVYYVEETNEFVVVSQDGYIRTYFLPSRGIDYFNAQ